MSHQYPNVPYQFCLGWIPRVTPYPVRNQLAYFASTKLQIYRRVGRDFSFAPGHYRRQGLAFLYKGNRMFVGPEQRCATRSLHP
jgi:hypothetical protein